MRIKFSVVGLLLLAACQLLMNAPGNSAYSISEEPLQFTDWLTFENLGPTVNTTVSDHRPTISKDGLSLYFGSNRAGGFGGTVEGTDLWVTQRDSVDSPWGAPQNLGGVINTPYDENAPSFSTDGHWMYFGSSRPGGCGNFDLYVSHRHNNKDDFGWEPPIHLGCGINSASDDDGATFFSDDDGTGENYLYFASNRPGGPGDFDIYVARLAGDYTTFDAPALVPELNSPNRDTRTSIRKDGLEIFLTSTRPGGQGGLDIWVSTRASTLDPWSTPVNLPAPINTSANDGAPGLSRDGTTMYFDSTRAGGLGGRDLVVSTRKKL